MPSAHIWYCCQGIEQSHLACLHAPKKKDTHLCPSETIFSIIPAALQHERPHSSLSSPRLFASSVCWAVDRPPKATVHSSRVGGNSLLSSTKFASLAATEASVFRVTPIHTRRSCPAWSSSSQAVCSAALHRFAFIVC